MKVLVDSDFWFGLLVSVDVHHDRSVKLLRDLYKQDVQLVSTNLVVQETATVISRKRNQKEAKVFLEELQKMPLEILVVGQDEENLAWKMFKKQTKSGTSFIDCANLAVYEKYKLDGILSFDVFYPKEVRI